MKETAIQSQFSARIRLLLVIGESTYPLAQIGPMYFVLRKATSLPRCAAEIVMIADGDEKRWPIILKDGAVPFDPHVEFYDAPGGPRAEPHASDRHVSEVGDR
jgi:hypothetical protein